MTRVLILLTLPEQVRAQYRAGLQAKFPEVQFEVVDHHSKAVSAIADKEVLVTFGPMLHDDVFRAAKKLKWVQALGTGVDGIVERPSLGEDVIVTKMHGFHGPPVSEAALMAMLALARDLPRAVRSQSGRKWDRFPAKTLGGKTVGILGVGVIAGTLAPMCKALGMQVIGISSTPRAVAGFDRIVPRNDLVKAVTYKAGMPNLRLKRSTSPGSHAANRCTSTPVGRVSTGAVTPQSWRARSILVDGASTRSHWSQNSRERRFAMARVNRVSQM